MSSEPNDESPPGPDPYDLERFVQAQASDYVQALSELRKLTARD